MYRFTIPRPPAETEDLAAARKACMAAIADPTYMRPPIIDAARRLREMQEAAARAPAELKRKLSEMAR